MTLQVVKRESPEDLSQILLNKYQGRGHRIITLLDKESDSSNPNDVIDAIKILEQKREVYVERRPRLRNRTLRTDLLSSDMVHFDTFPTIQRRSLLYRTGVEYGDYTINHVLGCAHGCRYPCYAMQLSKRYGRVKNYQGWMSPRLVGNALDLLERELPRYRSNIRFVHLSFMTDPFMFDAINKRNNPWVEELTLRIIKRLNEEGVKVTLLTKGLLPSVLANEPFSNENEYGITLVSLSTSFHDTYEPFSAPTRKRLASLKTFHEKGLKTWVSLEPYPTPNIVDQDLTQILEKLRFVDKFVFGKWNYNSLITGYEDSHKFYTECADQIIDFCKENGIALHIKEGTPRSSNDKESFFI